jgi:glycosyltransferase involved in cell wall biosynthesis
VAPNAPSRVFTETKGNRETVQGPSEPLPDEDRSGYFLCVGSLEPRKNLDRVCQAYLLLPQKVRREFPLYIAGRRSGIFAEQRRTDGEGIVELGYVTDDRLAYLYQNAHAVIFGSLAEGFGLPLVEALATGTQVLASDIPVFRWIGGETARYFDPIDVNDMASAFQQAARVDGRSQAEIAGRQRRAASFRWDESAAKIYEYVKRDGSASNR